MAMEPKDIRKHLFGGALQKFGEHAWEYLSVPLYALAGALLNWWVSGGDGVKAMTRLDWAVLTIGFAIALAVLSGISAWAIVKIRQAINPNKSDTDAKAPTDGDASTPLINNGNGESRLIARVTLLRECDAAVGKSVEQAREARVTLEELFSDKLPEADKPKAESLVAKWNDALHGVEQALTRAGHTVSIVMTNRGYVRSTYPLQGYGRHDQFAEAKMVRLFWDQVRAYDLAGPDAITKLHEELRTKNEQLERLGQA